MLDFHLVPFDELPAFEDGAFLDSPSTPPMCRIGIEAFHALRRCGLSDAFGEVSLSCFDDALLDEPAAMSLAASIRRAGLAGAMPIGQGDRAREDLLSALDAAVASGRCIVVICD